MTKQYVYTTNENQVAKIEMKLQDHIVVYVGREHGFKLSSIPLSGELLINAALQINVDKTLHAIAKIGKLTNTQENSFSYCNVFQDGYSIYWRPFR